MLHFLNQNVYLFWTEKFSIWNNQVFGYCHYSQIKLFVGKYFVDQIVIFKWFLVILEYHYFRFSIIDQK